MSLIELTVVLTIIGLVGMIALPRLDLSAGADRLGRAARLISVATRLARSEAITRQVPVRLILGRTELIGVAGEEPFWSGRLEEGAEIETAEIRGLSPGAEPSLSFLPDGRVSRAILTLGDGQEVLVLGIDPLTGRVTVIEAEDGEA